MKGRETVTFASSWLAKKGGLHMQKSYTISVSSFKASISKVFCGTLTTRTEVRQGYVNGTFYLIMTALQCSDN